MTSMNSADNPLDEKQQRESYEILIPLMETEDAAFLSMNKQIWTDIISWMVETGQIENAIDADEVIVGTNLK